MRKETVGFWDGSGISRTICKQSAPRSRQKTTTPRHLIFTSRMLFLMPSRQCESTEGLSINTTCWLTQKAKSWIVVIVAVQKQFMFVCIYVCSNSLSVCWAFEKLHMLNGPFSSTTQVSRNKKGKTNLDFTEARDNGISWAVCKSAPRSRQITMPAPHHSVFYRLDALPATQPTASKHWRHKTLDLWES